MFNLRLWAATMGWLAIVSASASAGQPSDIEQLWLQLVNRFRADPGGELDRLVNYRQPGSGLTWADPTSDSPAIAGALEFFDVDPAELRRQFQPLEASPPLVWSEQLHDSAQYYTGVVIAHDQQSHQLDQYTGPTGLLDRLAQEGGYDFSGGGTAGENLFAFAEDVLAGHAGFVIDWGSTPTGIQTPAGHRNNLLDPVFREIGIAVVQENNSSTQVGPLVTTQHLATDFADGPFLTGVIHRDSDGNAFYSVGEGLGGLSIELRPLGSAMPVVAATSYASGGFRLDLSDVGAGLYQMVLDDGQPFYWSSPIEVSSERINLTWDIRDPQFDIDSMSRAIRAGYMGTVYDLDNDGAVSPADRAFLIEHVHRTFLGDSNLDGEFNSSDLVLVFQAGEYEDADPLNSRWSSGDWDGDGDFTTGDLVVAFQDGGYDTGPRTSVALVPEPSTLSLSTWSLMAVVLLAGGLIRSRQQPT